MTRSEELIERGRKLHILLQDENFAVFLAELNDRIKVLCDEIDGWDGYTPDHNSILIRWRIRLGALRELRAWIDETIAIGGREKLRQISRQSDMDPQAVKSTNPVGAIGE